MKALAAPGFYCYPVLHLSRKVMIDTSGAFCSFCRIFTATMKRIFPIREGFKGRPLTAEIIAISLSQRTNGMAAVKSSTAHLYSGFVV